MAIGLSLIVQRDFIKLAQHPGIASALAKGIADDQALLLDPVAIGTALITTVTATCIIFEIVGPILTKYALRKAGEIPDA